MVKLETKYIKYSGIIYLDTVTATAGNPKKNLLNETLINTAQRNKQKNNKTKNNTPGKKSCHVIGGLIRDLG